MTKYIPLHKVHKYLYIPALVLCPLFVFVTSFISLPCVYNKNTVNLNEGFRIKAAYLFYLFFVVIFSLNLYFDLCQNSFFSCIPSPHPWLEEKGTPLLSFNVFFARMSDSFLPAFLIILFFLLFLMLFSYFIFLIKFPPRWGGEGNCQVSILMFDCQRGWEWLDTMDEDDLEQLPGIVLRIGLNETNLTRALLRGDYHAAETIIEEVRRLNIIFSVT